MKYIPLFIAIQLVSAVLFVVGIPVVGIAVLTHTYNHSLPVDQYHFPKWLWIFDNDEDGILPAWYDFQHHNRPARLNMFVWTAFRNSVNNLRYVKYVSARDRPMLRKTWGTRPGGFYIQAGWNSSGYPVVSGGRNVNAY